MAAHDANNDYSLGYNAYNVPQGQYLIGSNGKLNPNAVLGNIVEYGGQQYLIRPDKWLDEVYSHACARNITSMYLLERISPHFILLLVT